MRQNKWAAISLTPVSPLQIEFSGYTLAPLQPQFTNHQKSQETLITHIIKVRGSFSTPRCSCNRVKRAK